MVWQLLWLLVATQCPQQREKVTGADLYGMWWHSYEEDTDGKVYRREGHQFPLSRQGQAGFGATARRAGEYLGNRPSRPA
jgi:hypothetical protein